MSAACSRFTAVSMGLMGFGPPISLFEIVEQIGPQVAVRIEPAMSAFHDQLVPEKLVSRLKEQERTQGKREDEPPRRARRRPFRDGKMDDRHEEQEQRPWNGY